jgi:hypothetical protein
MTTSQLIIASVYIAAFELLSESIVEQIRDFFCLGFDDGGVQTDPKYQTDVLSRNRSPVYASLQWLQELGAIDDGDIALFGQAKKCRNTIAHEMTRLMAEGLPSDWPDRFQDIVSLLDKIEKWWIINVEIPTNPVFDGKDIDQSEIIPGRIAGLRMILDIALGSEKESTFYFDEFNKRIHGPNPV